MIAKFRSRITWSSMNFSVKLSEMCGGFYGVIFGVYLTACSRIWSYAPVIIYKTFVQNKR